MKEKSYSELVKSAAMKKQKQKESYMLDLYIDMLLGEIQLQFEKEKLLKEIDKALDDKNEMLFYQLSKQYINLQKRFGT